MRVSDVIAGFICEMIDSRDGCAELQRTELANRFGCVPSQINYVISTRFSPEHGYIVESRRGGGGYIRIRRVRQNPRCLIVQTVAAIGESLSFTLALAFLSGLESAGALTGQTVRLITAGVSQSALKCLPVQQRDKLRADILKQILLEILGDTNDSASAAGLE